MTKSRMEPSAKNAFAALGGEFRFGLTPGGGVPAGISAGSKTVVGEAIATKDKMRTKGQRLEDGSLKTFEGYG